MGLIQVKELMQVCLQYSYQHAPPPPPNLGLDLVGIAEEGAMRIVVVCMLQNGRPRLDN
jgi:hypothetical protein